MRSHLLGMRSSDAPGGRVDPRVVDAVRQAVSAAWGQLEATRAQVEAAVGDRHHGPVLGAYEVGDAERVPEHDVGIDEVAVLVEGALRRYSTAFHLTIAAAGAAVATFLVTGRQL